MRKTDKNICETKFNQDILGNSVKGHGYPSFF